LLVVEKLDRVVTTSAPMPPYKLDPPSHVVQIWRLSDLKLLTTLDLPQAPNPAVRANPDEARMLADGTTVLVKTAGCGLYRISGLAGANPSVVTLDVRDPSHPVQAGYLFFKDGRPHWLALEPGTGNLVITGFGSMLNRAYFATVSLETGALTLDSRTIDFDRKWPDGWNGPAVPHAALFY
jgi:hypothetical protein